MHKKLEGVISRKGVKGREENEGRKEGREKS